MPNITLSTSRRLRTAVARLTLPTLRLSRCNSSTQAIQDRALHATSLVPTAVNPIAVTSPRSSSEAHSPARLSKMKATTTIAKDALLLSLDALSQSADAFPPLKSVVGALLFIATQVEMVSSNKAQAHEIYAEIDRFAASLVRAVPDVTVLSLTAQGAIRALAEDVLAVRKDMEGIERQRLLKRFIRAKRHSAQLQDLLKQLNQADAFFTRTMLTSMDAHNTRILTCVQPLQKEVHRLFIWARFFFCTLPHLEAQSASTDMMKPCT
ncbi:hypothetical protein PENSPDRAFT_750114 [Peniophora sp. CONT]|nr:hypothetical protein PENSPDRAFT_750114 [Peniophora sp. CONT]